MIVANAASCHCLQNGHWKSLAMMTQIVAVESPAMRPRSARSVMLSCGIAEAAAVASDPFADPFAAVAGRAAALECEQPTASRTRAIAASDRSAIEGIGWGEGRP